MLSSPFFPLWPRRVSRIILITLWAPLTSHLSRVYCFRSEPCPSQLISDLYWLILTHTKLFFLLCLSIAVQMRGGECFRAYQAIFACPTILPSVLLPSWGRLLGELGAVSSLLVPKTCFAPVPTASVTSGRGSLRSSMGGQRKAPC